MTSTFPLWPSLVIAGGAYDGIARNYRSRARSRFVVGVVRVSLAHGLIVSGAVGITRLLAGDVIARHPFGVAENETLVSELNGIYF